MQYLNDHGSETIDLNSYATENEASRFHVFMDSNAMSGAGIVKGDLLLIDRDVTPESGMLVLAFTTEWLMRRYEVRDGKGWLLAEPMAGEPVPLSDGQIWGVVMGVHRNLVWKRKTAGTGNTSTTGGRR
ncbi:LexA family protein [Rufibacter roseus]|uniref:LexA family protein n=1 Tax=Rufibacter roseus TaxID=1567108 RepID=A0ABW2DJJ4_9BACT|nr:S24 family peptidase [Rufibacter roseus]